jgi:hypothetical protein
MKHKQQVNDATGVDDPIASLQAAIIAASEQGWAHHDVPEVERERLRPGVLALAQGVADRLRAEHAARAQR